MKIAAYSVDLSATHSMSKRYELQESLRAWTGNKRPDFEGNSTKTTQILGAAPASSNTQGNESSSLPSSVVAMISEAARTAAQLDIPSQPSVSNEAQAIAEAQDNLENDPILRLIRSMVEMLTGHKITTLSSSAMHKAISVDTPDLPNPNQAVQAQGQAQASPAPIKGYGVEYDRHEVYEETEQTSFQAKGMIRTTDGKEINFNIDLEMSRSYRAESNVSVREGDAVKKDPLVINFGGTAAQLQNQRFSFDLDSDGKAENVPMLAGNSGYLAFDLNGNGKIDSGKELFGATTGNGFTELARLDSDKNGWIDENDLLFDKLRVWLPDGKDGGSLTTLKQRGIGALFLGQQATPFAIKDGGNRELGDVRASGVYVNENGSVGSLQQIDLTV